MSGLHGAKWHRFWAKMSKQSIPWRDGGRLWGKSHRFLHLGRDLACSNHGNGQGMTRGLFDRW